MSVEVDTRPFSPSTPPPARPVHIVGLMCGKGARWASARGVLFGFAAIGGPPRGRLMVRVTGPRKLPCGPLCAGCTSGCCARAAQAVKVRAGCVNQYCLRRQLRESLLRARASKIVFAQPGPKGDIERRFLFFRHAGLGLGAGDLEGIDHAGDAAALLGLRRRDTVNRC